MKTTLSKFIQPAIAIFALVLIVTAASAWTGPTAAFPAGNVPAPLNTGSVTQEKTGGDLKLVKSGNLGGNLWAYGSTLASDMTVAGSLVQSARGMFGSASFSDIAFAHDVSNTDVLRAIVNRVSTVISQVTITGANGLLVSKNGDLRSGRLFLDANGGGVVRGLTIKGTGEAQLDETPLTINLQNSSNLVDMLILNGNTNSNHVGDPIGVVSNKATLQFWNSHDSKFMNLNMNNAHLWGNIQIEGGNPGPGKILVSTDNVGSAQWAGTNTTTTNGLIRYGRASNGGSAATAYCGDNQADDANWTVIGGGGDCQYGTQISQPVTDRNGNAHGNGFSGDAVGWHLDCLDKNGSNGVGTVVGNGGQSGDAHAEVICMRKTPILTSVVASAQQGGGGGGAPLTWTTPTTGDCTTNPSAFGCIGNQGWSCDQWLANVGHTATRATAKINGSAATVSPATTTCAYKHMSTPSDLPQGITVAGHNTVRSSCQIHPSSYSDSMAFPASKCDASATVDGSTGQSYNLKTEYGN